MLSNNIKSGMPIILTYNRKGYMRDNKKGIIRTVEVEVPGQGTDIGSCYINELVQVKVDERWESVELEPHHKKKLSMFGGQ